MDTPLPWREKRASCYEQEGRARASNVMSTGVVTTEPETTVDGVAQMFTHHRISGPPVAAKDGRWSELPLT
jgi:CBS domain-containing protein